MKERLINTRFWNDNWVRSINPLDRYLFIYLLTNEYTNISGIYELPLPTMAFGSGLDERDLEKVMLPRLEPKVFYKDGWVIMVNFLKHQHIGSEQVKIGIQNELKNAPKKVVELAISRGYAEGIDTITRGYNISNLIKSNLKIAVASLPPFEWNNYLKEMENNKRRDLQVIAFYFKEKGIRFNTLAETRVAIKRHLRAAKDLAVFDDKKINSVMNEIKSNKDFKDIFTIETLVKLATK